MRYFKDFLLRSLAVRENVAVGPQFHVGPRSTIWAPNQLTIGRNVYVGKNVTIEVDGSIGDEVLIANNVGIVGRKDHDLYEVGSAIRSATWIVNRQVDQADLVQIGSDVWIGFGAVVLSGVRIGDSSVVGAGSIVTQDVPCNSIVAGSPAKFTRPRFSEHDLRTHWEHLTKNNVRVPLVEKS